ncbi:AmmeMemoRadiSam system protein B [Polyangium jinanense]|uniref:AmmeMemoRadiSam system protein B n=1 Tax=Polyangium jinanense TaxID=2829994 RepID=A0A9X4AVZ2_9BACT|nr:AmmeMemoRadiSam system protein B [Polyangium jinanense]MDC3957146.1 AmmeMemoRadiSam system protein B [Polyangium jinanense]MDC3986824.1 AmmeMemoRadiSam system protein B [Polyangium jinanense]
MPKPHAHPRLRPIEAIFVPHPTFGKALMLRDGEGIAPSSVAIRGDLAPIVSCMDGTSSLDGIARRASRTIGRMIDVAIVSRLVAELDEAYMLETPRFQARRREVVAAFAAASERPAHHAGGAYHRDPEELARYIEEACLAKAPRGNGASHGRLVGLCAPHMDLWRAAEGYGHAYGALAEALPPEVDTFFLLGTSHAPMRQPFAVCDKRFATPLGALEPDHDALAFLAAHSRFDVREDEYLHKGEHSLELQVIFLRHLLGDRPARIVPVLCGLGDAQARGRDPREDARAESFLAALAELVERRGARAFLIAGADLAHVGPRFGDPRPLDAAERDALQARDAESIRLMVEHDASGFFSQVAEDLDTRRVCGLGPIYTALRALPGSAAGRLLHYTQCVDPVEGSIVSHASLTFVS